MRNEQQPMQTKEKQTPQLHAWVLLAAGTHLHAYHKNIAFSRFLQMTVVLRMSTMLKFIWKKITIRYWKVVAKYMSSSCWTSIEHHKPCNKTLQWSSINSLEMVTSRAIYTHKLIVICPICIPKISSSSALSSLLLALLPESMWATASHHVSFEFIPDAFWHIDDSCWLCFHDECINTISTQKSTQQSIKQVIIRLTESWNFLYKNKW